MMLPSTTTMLLGLAITAALAIVDWYVWRAAPTLPYPFEPTGTRFADDDDAAAFRKVA